MRMQNKSSRAFTANGEGAGGAGAPIDKQYVIEKFAAKPAVFHRTQHLKNVEDHSKTQADVTDTNNVFLSNLSVPILINKITVCL